MSASAPAEAAAPARSRQLSSAVRIIAFAALLGGLGVWLLSVTPAPLEAADGSWTIPLLVLALGFGIAEATALHVEIRKESHSLSLSAIPLMIGVLHASPVTLAAAYVLGGAPVLLLIRRSDLLKTFWNSSLLLAEAALAAFIVRLLLGQQLPSNAAEWLVPLSGVLAAELVSLLAVSLVIMTVDARFRPALFADVGRSQILAALGGAFTVTALAAALTSPSMLVYALVPVLGIAALLRSTGHLTQRFADLKKLHSFTRALTNERGARTLDTGLAHLVEIMRTKTAGLIVLGQETGTSGRALIDETFADLNADPLDQLLFDIVQDGQLAQLTSEDADPGVRELLRHFQAAKMLAVRVLGETDRQGVLFVSDRLGMRREFTGDELRLFGSLADTLSARLTNDYLVEQLEEQAQHDALTGLPNRLNFEIALTSLLANPGRRGVVLMVDLDRFKDINDSLGHETGDRLLIEIARRLQGVTRAADMVARFGGDEFALFLTGRDFEIDDALERRLSSLHSRLIERVQIDGITFEVGASIGVARWPDQGSDSSTLLRRADSAMYDAKRNQRGVVWYRPSLDADAPRRLELSQAARTALERSELFIEIQPKVSTRDGQVTGVEALARWTHPVHGSISPNEFVPLIAQAGLTGRLTRHVLEHAIAIAVQLRGDGYDVPVAVNLTPRDLLDPTLPDDIATILADAGVHPSALEVEITEDAMVVDFDASVAVLARIRALGVRIALDDFGTGYSSLQHLHLLPVDQLKIDRGFIGRLAADDSAIAIVRAAINLAQDLGLQTVAEGVEDNVVAALVTELGCDAIQGYAIGKPMSPAAFPTWARQWESSDRSGATVGPQALGAPAERPSPALVGAPGLLSRPSPGSGPGRRPFAIREVSHR